MKVIPDYIREHVLHARPPEGCCVPEGSIPDVAEGHFYTARAATVGINPHGVWKREHFLPKDHSTLDKDELDEIILDRVWEEKTRYFERHRHRYFTFLEPILNQCGVTYGGQYGSHQPELACSLDLVQWPTDPLWNELPIKCSPNAQSKLLNDGKAFFEKLLLENQNIELLLGNGRTVVEHLERTFKVQFEQWKVDELGVHIFCGYLLGRRFVGWSTFLSRSPLNSSQRGELARMVDSLQHQRTSGQL